MLIAARHLLDRLHHVRSRADEVRTSRERLAAAADGATEQERVAAKQIRRLRLELAAAFVDVRACGGCARGYPEPHGHWDGGHCCGGRTEEIFTDDELAALALAGTTPGALRLPIGGRASSTPALSPRTSIADHAGCAFRGPAGCSLATGDRPNVCIRYVCRGLERELRERGDHARIAALSSELRAAVARFGALRAARLENAPLVVA